MIATLTIGIIIGALAGVSLVFVVLESTKKKYKSTPPNPTKTAKLLTVGSLVRWKKDTMNDVVYEIEQFQTDEDGQTVADINIVNGTIGFTVPIEELEGAEE